MEVASTWNRFREIVARKGVTNSIPEDALKAFEIAHHLTLPASYRNFCKEFGPGSLRGRIWIHIAVPLGNSPAVKSLVGSKQTDIEALNQIVRSAYLTDLEEYCPDPELLRSAVFFGSDILTNQYFWDTNSPLIDSTSHELPVYVITRGWEVHRLANSFDKFIYNTCLEVGLPDAVSLDYDPPIFEAPPET